MTPEGEYDEALQRFHATGPEFEGWRSNHGPMVVEALSRRGAGRSVHAWTDAYAGRLDERPRGRWRIGEQDWRDPLGDPSRTGDWIELFERAVAEMPWPDVVATWWPRLLPGIAAGATHGVIRTGHALRAARDLETEPRRVEVAQALAYWAARWQPVPVTRATGSATAGGALDAIPSIADQRFGIRYRLRVLATTDGFSSAAARVAQPRSAAEAPTALAGVVDAAVAAYPRLGVGSPTMLVHAATAPNAVLMALPSLPESLWLDSFDAAWAATAAVVAVYRPAQPVAPAPPSGRDGDVAAAFARATAHGGEHVIKLADTALSSYERTANASALVAVDTAIHLGA